MNRQGSGWKFLTTARPMTRTWPIAFSGGWRWIVCPWGSIPITHGSGRPSRKYVSPWPPAVDTDGKRLCLAACRIIEVKQGGRDDSIPALWPFQDQRHEIPLHGILAAAAGPPCPRCADAAGATRP